eukprot:353769-Chlamydomonas_euryale.AAC.4
MSVCKGAMRVDVAAEAMHIARTWWGHNVDTAARCNVLCCRVPSSFFCRGDSSGVGMPETPPQMHSIV